jgi:methyl-accepting chemotaxis protein/phage host-nuclease inhibitor protein Gam
MAFDKDLLIRILGDSTSLNNSLTDSEKRVKAFANKVGSIGQVMTVVGGAITAVSIGLVKMASDAEETSSKFATVFKDVSDEADKTAKNLAINFGLSANAAKQLLSDTGDLLTGFGFTGQAALDLSTKVNELAVDLASFTNYSGGAEGASAALTKALLGERESVKSLGISIMETDVQAKVLELTQKGMTFETDRQAKAYATLFIAQEQSKNAIGDFSRTSEGFANQMRILKARLNDVVVALGEKLLPMATSMVGKVTEVVTKVNEWIEAHPKLVEWIVKTGAVLGGLVLVGGPVLMAVSAFIKAKSAIDNTTFALKLLNTKITILGTISTGPIGILIAAIGGLYIAWETNLFGMRDITEEVFASIKGNFVDLQNTLSGGGGGAGAFFGEIGEEGKKVIPIFNDMAGALDIVNKKAGTNEWGQIIETYDEWVARLEATAEATKGVTDKILELNDPLGYQIELLNREADALREAGVEESILTDWYEKAKNKLTEDSEATKTAITLKEKLADMTKTLTDKIYEFTHTDEEVKLRDINREYDALIENAKEVYTNYNELRLAIEAINEARQEEINSLNKANEAVKETVTKNEELKNSYEELKPAIEEAGKIAEQAGILGGSTWEGFTTQINNATTALNNFTAEGVAAAIANVYMKYAPMLQNLREDLETTTGVLHSITEAQIKQVKEWIKEQTAIIKQGYSVYQNVLASMGSGSGSSSSLINSYDVGTRYVPKTQLAIVHEGEEINPPGQRSYDQRKSNYTTSISIESGAIVIQTPKFNEQDGEKIFDMIEKKAKQRGLSFAGA